MALNEKIKIFGINVFDKENNKIENIEIDATHDSEKLIGEALGYYAVKYPNSNIFVSDCFSAGYSQYSYENGTFVDHDIKYDINKDFDVSLIEKCVEDVINDKDNIEQYVPQNINMILYQSPMDSSKSYEFIEKNNAKINKVIFDTDKMNDFLNHEGNNSNDNNMNEMISFYLEAIQNNYLSDTLHLMPKEIKPYLISVEKGNEFATYDVSIQIGDKVISNTLKYDSQSIQEYGDPDNRELVGALWELYMGDNVLRKESLMRNEADHLIGYVYNLDGYHNGGIEFEGTPENIASFIMNNQNSRKMIITDLLDLPKVTTIGYFLDRVESMELRNAIMEYLLPMQEGELKPNDCGKPTNNKERNEINGSKKKNEQIKLNELDER